MILETWRKKRTIKHIRNHMTFFGCDVSHLTDGEIEEAIIAMAQIIARQGPTVEDMARALRWYAAYMVAE